MLFSKNVDVNGDRVDVVVDVVDNVGVGVVDNVVVGCIVVVDVHVCVVVDGGGVDDD